MENWGVRADGRGGMVGVAWPLYTQGGGTGADLYLVSGGGTLSGMCRQHEQIIIHNATQTWPNGPYVRALGPANKSRLGDPLTIPPPPPYPLPPPPPPPPPLSDLPSSSSTCVGPDEYFHERAARCCVGPVVAVVAVVVVARVVVGGG